MCDDIKCSECGTVMQASDQLVPFWSLHLPFIGAFEIYKWESTQYCPQCIVEDDWHNRDLREASQSAYDAGYEAAWKDHKYSNERN